MTPYLAFIAVVLLLALVPVSLGAALVAVLRDMRGVWLALGVGAAALVCAGYILRRQMMAWEGELGHEVSEAE